jgi:integrase/recombinase XerD
LCRQQFDQGRRFLWTRDICSESKVRIYQGHLVQTKKLAPGSVGVAPAALRSLYRVTLKRGWVPGDIPMPKKPFKLPALPSPEEVTHFPRVR